MQIIRPKHDWELGRDVPYFYLIGPVLGGGDWQHEMCRALERRVGECIIATPTRWETGHSLSRHFVGTLNSHYERQTDWEQVFIDLALARPRSCLVSFLPAESRTNPRTDGNPYGRDTYGELRYFRGLMASMGPLKRKRFPLVLGGQDVFPGLSVIRRNLDRVWRGSFPFHHSIAKVQTTQ